MIDWDKYNPTWKEATQIAASFAEQLKIEIDRVADSGVIFCKTGITRWRLEVFYPGEEEEIKTWEIGFCYSGGDDRVYGSSYPNGGIYFNMCDPECFNKLEAALRAENLIS